MNWAYTSTITSLIGADTMANSGFVDYVIDLLSGYGNISSRRMFGGYGLYCNKIIFAIIIDDELYFKANDDLE